MEWLKDNAAEELLPGLNMTPQQLFWISSSQYKCSKLSDEELREQIRTSEYAPWPMRNNGTAMSSPEFSKDFNWRTRIMPSSLIGEHGLCILNFYVLQYVEHFFCIL